MSEGEKERERERGDHIIMPCGHCECVLNRVLVRTDVEGAAIDQDHLQDRFSVIDPVFSSSR